MFGDYNGAIAQLLQQGPWPSVSFRVTLRKGVTSPDVAILRDRLQHTNDLVGVHTTNVFDDIIEQSVIRFQDRHTLAADGVVGPKTVAALNIPYETRLKQLQSSQKIYEKIPVSVKRVIINIPAFQVWAHRNDVLEFEMDCIIGRVDRKTAIFSDVVEYADFRPYWNIPASIFKKDKLPHILKEGPKYLDDHDYEVVNDAGKIINHYNIDWEKYRTSVFPYMMRQRPGPTNSLGLVKYMYPNKYSMYMHDTPEKNLFKESVRAFSSGCCRLSNPPKMGSFLLDWTEQQVTDMMNGPKNHNIIGLPKDKFVPVHITYIIAWVDDSNITHFGNDIYKYNA